MKFKTDASCGHCKATILKTMQAKFPNAEWSLDLDHADKILEVHGLPENEETAAQVEKTLQETGFQGTWLRHTGY